MPIHKLSPTASKLTLAVGLLSIGGMVTPSMASADTIVGLANTTKSPVSVAVSENIDFVRPLLEDAAYGLETERISFINHATLPATEVDFRVTRDGQTRFVRDLGTFSPGVTIRRTTSAYEGAPYLSNPASWDVISVRYADGTTWSRQPAPSVANAK